jgi:acyl dehydratase
VHVDADYARNNGFEGVVMHGAILNGFLSHFVGMRLPGRRSLELTVDIRYLNPSYLGDKIRLAGTIAQKIDSRRVVVMDVKYHNESRNTVVARARVQATIMGE